MIIFIKDKYLNINLKILLLGDLSGVHKNLQIGLHECGYINTTLATTGDGFKNIKGDLSLPTLNDLSIKNKLIYRAQFINYIKSVKGFDVVQIAGPFTLPFPFFPYKQLISFLKNHNGKVFLSACGNDSLYWKNLRYKLKYGPFEDEINHDLGGLEPKQLSENSISFNNYIANSLDGIIPVLYEYEEAYKGFRNLRSLIPQPIATSKLNKNICVSDEKPIKVIHGVTRPGFKGTRHISKAFNLLNKSFMGKAEFILQSKCALNKYLEMMENVSIVVDQCNTYSYGMNALISMALGKVVFSGAEKEIFKSLKINDSPVINIIPDPDFIYESLSNLIQNPKSIVELSEYSRKYVEDNHDAPLIAQKYIKEWKK